MKKKTPAKRPRPKKASGPSEQELVRETVSKATGVTFEIIPPHPAFPLPAETLDWFMRCRNKDEIGRAPYLNVAWKEKGDGIWLESLAVGDTVDWIELAYGDEKAGESLDIDYSRFKDPKFQEDFSQRFPIVTGRIGEYERTIEGVGKQRKVELELHRAGSKGILVFTVAGSIKGRMSAQSLQKAVGKTASAMKEAYEQIAKLGS